MEEVLARVRQGLTLGANSVVFSGGEPTVRSDFMRLAEFCFHEGIPLGLISNGRYLAYPQVVRQLADWGLEYAYLSLHGPPTIHDALTATAGAHRQTMAALRNLDRVPSVITTCNVVVSRHNLDVLSDVVEFVASLRHVHLKFSLVEPKGSVLDDPKMIPDPRRAAEAVRGAMVRARRLGLPPERLGIDGFPHCLLPEYGFLQCDMYSHGIFAIHELEEDDFYPIDYGNMGKPDTCLGCGLGDPCRGTYLRTLEMFDKNVLEPIPGGVANSYNYFPVPREHGALVPVDPDRELRCVRTGKVESFATDTGDFQPQDIVAVRDRWQQVYVQTDDACMVNDFPNQLRKLNREGDGGVFVPAARDVFAAAEERVRQVVCSVSGAVLDVGFGEVRYGDWLFPRLASGEVSYEGVDPHPDEETFQRLVAGGAVVHRAAVEGLSVRREVYDWVLVLRSHNHLRDLWEAYNRIVASLKWGGHLLVVDNMAFGLVRPTVTLDRLNALPRMASEHLRNHKADEAWAFLSCFPLTVVERHDVDPRGANQWLLHLVKSWPSGLTAGKDLFRTMPVKSGPMGQS
jgi:MoaA/NifB/PqqE/SkfB family radical SAM enzyme/SAM-dependent methyltransferase